MTILSVPNCSDLLSQKIDNPEYSLSEQEWERTRYSGDFDYIVIGSGPCSLGFVDRVLQKNHNARILVIERGGELLRDHFQNLCPLANRETILQEIEISPWIWAEENRDNQYIKKQVGIVPFVGGRSLFWSTWCPRPEPSEMEGWPQQVVETIENYLDSAERLLHVTPLDRIGRGEFSRTFVERPERDIYYGVLQGETLLWLQQRLNSLSNNNIPQRVSHARLAAQPTLHNQDFWKFSSVTAFIDLWKNNRPKLKFITGCFVKKIEFQGNQATSLETTRGSVNIANSKVILAVGAIPATTLVLNSLGDRISNAGTHYTAHFTSSIFARIKREHFRFQDALGNLELAGLYLDGRDSETQGQYHMQLTAVSIRKLENELGRVQAKLQYQNDLALAQFYMPSLISPIINDQLEENRNYICFGISALGEMRINSESRLDLNNLLNLNSDVNLRAILKEDDYRLWNNMDKAIYNVIEQALTPDKPNPYSPNQVEYWRVKNNQGFWSDKQRPSRKQIRKSFLVHEGSTLWLGNDDDAIVGLDYRLKSGQEVVADNIYITGSALWPRSGSWNPTLTMVALSQHLADTLERNRNS